MAKKSTNLEIWEKENIPVADTLFCFLHHSAVNKKLRIPYERAFRNTPFIGGTNLSSDWNKYSSAQQTQARLGLHPKPSGGYKNPNDYFVVKLSIKDIYNLVQGQKIEHDPIQNQPPLPDNRAHSIIIGEKDEEVRLKLVDICEWAIAPPDFEK